MMLDSTIIVAIVSAVEGIGIAVIGLIVSSINRKNEEYRTKREQREERDREQRKRQAELLKEYETAKLDLLFATANATDVLLQAAHGDHINGNVEKARESISKAKSECNHVVNRNSGEIVGGFQI